MGIKESAERRIKSIFISKTLEKNIVFPKKILGKWEHLKLNQRIEKVLADRVFLLPIPVHIPLQHIKITIDIGIVRTMSLYLPFI